jgi:hypothetical protein
VTTGASQPPLASGRGHDARGRTLDRDGVAGGIRFLKLKRFPGLQRVRCEARGDAGSISGHILCKAAFHVERLLLLRGASGGERPTVPAGLPMSVMLPPECTVRDPRPRATCPSLRLERRASGRRSPVRSTWNVPPGGWTAARRLPWGDASAGPTAAPPKGTEPVARPGIAL